MKTPITRDVTSIGLNMTPRDMEIWLEWWAWSRLTLGHVKPSTVISIWLETWNLGNQLATCHKKILGQITIETKNFWTIFHWDKKIWERFPLRQKILGKISIETKILRPFSFETKNIGTIFHWDNQFWENFTLRQKILKQISIESERNWVKFPFFVMRIIKKLLWLKQKKFVKNFHWD